LEQKEEEKYEEETVKAEVEAFRANQTALAEEATLREMASYSQNSARSYQSNMQTYNKKKVSVQKTMSTRTQEIKQVTKDLASAKPEDKEKLQKRITQLNTENERDKTMLENDEKDLAEQDKKVKEFEEITKKQEEVAKKAEKAAGEVEKKVSVSQDNIIKNCAKQSEGKKKEQKK